MEFVIYFTVSAFLYVLMYNFLPRDDDLDVLYVFIAIFWGFVVAILYYAGIPIIIGIITHYVIKYIKNKKGIK